MMFTVNPFPLLTFLAVSLIRGELEQEKDTMGGQLVTWSHVLAQESRVMRCRGITPG